MWRPSKVQKHALPVVDWPDQYTAEAARWFSPIAVGPVELFTRTWIPAMVPWRATAEGYVSDDVIAWYQRFARGKPGAIVIEATGIRDVPSGPLLRIGDDRFIPGLKRLVEAVEEASDGKTRLFIQLIDFLNIRRRPDPEKFFRRFLAVTDAHRQALDLEGLSEDTVRARLLGLDRAELASVLTARELESLDRGARERVDDLFLPHIAALPEQLPELFAAAAARADVAGFDGVELHYAHAYTMASFLSALNQRSDGYGGNLEGRARLPVEVMKAVLERISGDRAVGTRILSDEIVAGGSTVDDACYFATELSRAGAQFISLSRGGKFEDAKQPRVGWSVYPYTGQSGYECMPTVHSDAQGPFRRNLAATRQVRQALRQAGGDIPVVACGGVHSLAQAEAALTDGTADIVAAARQSLADPDWFLKLQLGRGKEIRRCEYTNYCEGLDQMHKLVTCKLWDRTQLDSADCRLSADGKRRLEAPEWPGRGS